MRGKRRRISSRLSPHDLADPAVDCRLRRLACSARRSPLVRRDGTERRSAAVAEDDVEAADVVDGFAVDDGARAGGVVADHAAEVGPARRWTLPARKGGRASARARLKASRTTPGWTRAVPAPGSMSRTALRYLLQSRTTPGPIDWPDRLVPPPRGVIGTCISRGDLHRGDDILGGCRAGRRRAARSGRCWRRCCKGGARPTSKRTSPARCLRRWRARLSRRSSVKSVMVCVLSTTATVAARRHGVARRSCQSAASFKRSVIRSRRSMSSIVLRAASTASLGEPSRLLASRRMIFCSLFGSTFVQDHLIGGRFSHGEHSLKKLFQLVPFHPQARQD